MGKVDLRKAKFCDVFKTRGGAKVSNDWKEREHSEDIVDIWEHK